MFCLCVLVCFDSEPSVDPTRKNFFFLIINRGKDDDLVYHDNMNWGNTKKLEVFFRVSGELDRLRCGVVYVRTHPRW